MFGIQGPEAYTYTSRSNCLEVAGIDDVSDFSETIVSPALHTVHPSCRHSFATESYADHFSLAGILWSGNVQFNEKDDGNAQVFATRLCIIKQRVLKFNSGCRHLCH
jgi:myosin I